MALSAKTIEALRLSALATASPENIRELCREFLFRNGKGDFAGLLFADSDAVGRSEVSHCPKS